MVVIIMCLDLQLPMQLVLITVKVVSSIQHYVIKYDSGLPQGRWFSPGVPVPSTNKNDRHDIAELLL